MMNDPMRDHDSLAGDHNSAAGSGVPPREPTWPDSATRVAKPDQGSSLAAMIAWIAACVIIGLIIAMNQFPSSSAPPAASAAPATIEAPELLDPTAAMAKILVKLGHVVVGKNDAASRESLISQIDASAKSPVDRLRVAMAAAELGGIEAGRSRVSILLNDQNLPEQARSDAMLFQQVLDAPDPMALDQGVKEGLVERHGWFARLALSRGLPDEDARRAGLLRGGMQIVAVFISMAGVAVIAVFGGLGCFAAAVAMLVTGRLRPRFVAPDRGGSVFLEILPVFAGGFLLIKIVLPYLITRPDGSVPDWATQASMAAQWALVPACLWPLLRGVGFQDLRQRMGWHLGRGLFTEMAAGVFGYLACLPIFACAVAVSVVLAFLVKGGASGASGNAPELENPVIDLISRASSFDLVMFFVLATCWAPIVEEAVFRGAFFRHLRSRLPLLGAAAVSAFVFGAMHGYEFFMLGPVISLGFCFALIREWRGSLVGCMTAHFLHNATALSLLMFLLPVLRD